MSVCSSIFVLFHVLALNYERSPLSAISDPPQFFDGRIVLDQNWALEAIYALFERKKTLRALRRAHGRFTRVDLETLIWSDYTLEEQKVFLGMMESCGICFRVRQLPHDSQENEYELEYLAPELLPPWADAQEQLSGRLRDDPPAAEAEARYAFLHEGILRSYLSKIGQHAKDAPIYWKYGCWFYEKTTRSQTLIESQWDDASIETGAGTIRFRAWGEHGRQLIEPLVAELQRMPVGQLPEIKGVKKAAPQSSHPIDLDGKHKEGLHGLVIAEPPRPSSLGASKAFVSYAWGDDASEEARRRGQVVEGLCESVQAEGWEIVRDKTEMRYGDLISDFMRMLGQADLVIVVLSAKYLQSPYCMAELHDLYRNARQEKQTFLCHVIPLVLSDARIGSPEERVEHAKHWETRYLKLKSDLDYLAVDDFSLYQNMKRWYMDVGNMLAYVNDVLAPHGFDNIVKNDFVALRQMLSQRISA